MNNLIFSDFGVHSTFIEITNICNMHCAFCPTDLIKAKKRRMDFSTFSKVIDQVASLKPVEAVSLNILGEPLMHPEVFRFVDYCKDKGLRIYLFTNGTLTAEHVREICKRDNIEALVLSYQTPDRQSYRLRGCRIPFEDYHAGMVAALDYIISSGAWQKMRVEIHLANTKHLPFPEWSVLDDNHAALLVMRELARVVKRLHAKYVAGSSDLDAVEKSIDQDFNRVPENILDLREWHYWGYAAAPNIYIRIKYMGTFGAIPELLPKTVTIVENCSPIQCDMLSAAICVHCDGTITNCCLDVNGEIGLGNVKTHSLLDALQSERRKASIENATINALCRRCLGKMVYDPSRKEQENQ